MSTESLFNYPLHWHNLGLLLGSGRSGDQIIKYLEKNLNGPMDYQILTEFISVEEIIKYKIVFVVIELDDHFSFNLVNQLAHTTRSFSILSIGLFVLPMTPEGIETQIPHFSKLKHLKSEFDSLLILSRDLLSCIFGTVKQKQLRTKIRQLILLTLKSIACIAFHAGQLGLDISVVKSVMSNSSFGFITTRVAIGKNRATVALSRALNNSLTSSSYLQSAKNLLIRINSADRLIQFEELEEFFQTLVELVDINCDIQWDYCSFKEPKGELRITILATGFDEPPVYLPN